MGLYQSSLALLIYLLDPPPAIGLKARSNAGLFRQRDGLGVVGGGLLSRRN